MLATNMRLLIMSGDGYNDDSPGKGGFGGPGPKPDTPFNNAGLSTGAGLLLSTFLSGAETLTCKGLPDGVVDCGFGTVRCCGTGYSGRRRGCVQHEHWPGERVWAVHVCGERNCVTVRKSPEWVHMGAWFSPMRKLPPVRLPVLASVPGLSRQLRLPPPKDGPIRLTFLLPHQQLRVCELPEQDSFSGSAASNPLDMRKTKQPRFQCCISLTGPISAAVQSYYPCIKGCAGRTGALDESADQSFSAVALSAMFPGRSHTRPPLVVTSLTLFIVSMGCSMKQDLDSGAAGGRREFHQSWKSHLMENFPFGSLPTVLSVSGPN